MDLNNAIKQVADKLQKKKVSISKEAEKNIAGIYAEIAKDMNKEIEKIDIEKYSEQDLRKLQKSTKQKMAEAQKKIEKIVEDCVDQIVVATTTSQLTFLNKVDKALGTSLSSSFKGKIDGIRKKITDKIKGGDIYKDHKKLSDRIWLDLKQNQGTIDAIINHIIKNKLHPNDIAKQLGQFVNPNRKKPFDYSIVYPHSKKKVEYNALRHVRTQINHAQHQAVIEMAKNDRLVKQVKWLSAHSHRTCTLCNERNGQPYDLDKVPIDHPNGMCSLFAMYPDEKTMDKLMDGYMDSDFDDLNKYLDSINF